MRLGLVLGGGGVVGIAWEIGVLAALRRAAVLDPAADAAVIVGTSAGSVVGSRLALGHDLDDLVEEQRMPPREDTGSRSAGTTDLSAVMEIFTELRQAGEVTPDVTRVVGAKAMAAPTPPEDRWIASFETTLGGSGAWPSAPDLRIAALDCHTGERRMWTAADAEVVPLATAVASSCAVPGMFPTVGIAGSRYTDGGVWSVTNADVLADDALDAVLLVVPTAGAAARQPARRPAFEVEADRLEAAGAATATITPGPAFAERIGLMNLMNPAFRATGVEVGLADGAAGAELVRSLLSGRG